MTREEWRNLTAVVRDARRTPEGTRGIKERPYYYVLDANGDAQPCEDVHTWAAWFNSAERHLAHDMDEGAGAEGVRVSTVFLGLDHEWGDGPPVLWETLVFGGALDGEMKRYTTRAAAMAGHREICRRVAARQVTRRGTVE